jgi:major outer membrane protein P.IB
MSGNLDFAFGSAKIGTAKAGNTVSTKDMTSSTSVIKITAVEDLGNGTKATVHFGLDPRVLANDAGALGRDEMFVGLSGKLGNMRLGSPNSIGLTTFLAGNPFGTGVGGGYAKIAADYSNVRYDRSARYDSPVVAGFTASLLRSTGNDAAVGAITTTAQPVTEAGLNYVNGPLTAGFAHIAQQAHAGNVKTSTNVLVANYKAGMATVYASWNDGDAKARTTTPTGTSTTIDTKGASAGVKITSGQIDLLAGYNQQKTNTDTEKVTGLRADYNFSKTTAVYAGYEKYDSKNNAADQTIYSVGLRKSF